jgi:hypothetical protein
MNEVPEPVREKLKGQTVYEVRTDENGTYYAETEVPGVYLILKKIRVFDEGGRELQVMLDDIKVELEYGLKIPDKYVFKVPSVLEAFKRLVKILDD